jgi:TonB family protein
MGHRLKRTMFLVCVVWTLGGGITRGWTQQESPPKPVSVGAQAASVILKHYALNPVALDPKTEQPLPSNGSWSVGKVPPASCPQTKETCVEVFYEVPAESVRCSWVVLLNGDDTDGQFLDENDDTERYMLLKIAKSEARALVETRKKPTYPPIAVALQASGSVVVDVLVGKTGEAQKPKVVSGPPVLQGAAIDAARSWRFKPMMVGARAVPYEIQLVFTFRTLNPSFTIVEVAP